MKSRYSTFKTVLFCKNTFGINPFHLPSKTCCANRFICQGIGKYRNLAWRKSWIRKESSSPSEMSLRCKRQYRVQEVQYIFLSVDTIYRYVITSEQKIAMCDRTNWYGCTWVIMHHGSFAISSNSVDNQRRWNEGRKFASVPDPGVCRLLFRGFYGQNQEWV